ncbi:hypothetical protein ACFLSJ_06990 [Verrucomicrobiota bacterium]
MLKRILSVLALGCLPFMAPPCGAGTVVFRILASNPIGKTQTVSVRSDLPPRVGTNDIVSGGGLNLVYDFKTDTYRVQDEIELGPQETKQFDIEINDIWSIDSAKLDRLESQARDLVARLDGLEYHDTAVSLKRRIDETMADIRSRQAENRIRPGVRPIQHIRAYEANLELLARVKRDVGHVENLVLGAGQDPGELVGAPAKLNPDTRRPVPRPKDGYRAAVIRISVRNTSPDETRTIHLKRDLPPEVHADDIIDADGLDVRTDPSRGLSYVEMKELSIAPAQTVSFDVRVRDKWNVNRPRAEVLVKASSELLSRVKAKGQYDSLETTLETIITELESIRQEQGPAVLNDAYVAFYRGQAGRLDVAEDKLNRIEDALQPIEAATKWGFNVQPPSPKTTWLIIYIILGFLAVVSLIFFFRWYGRTQAEKMDSPPHPPDQV